jgi:hypothetical protein
LSDLRLRVTDLTAPGRELGHEHVLALGGELDDPVGRHHRHAGVAEHPQGVVLELGQAAGAVVGTLVLQPAVEHRAGQLVDAVGAHVLLGEELGEQLAGLHREPHRRRPRRAGQPERLDLHDVEAELGRHRGADGLAPGAAEVEVR